MEMEEKVQEYQEEIQEIKSQEYRNMINSIKEEEVLCSQTQALIKDNTLLRQQLKQCTLMNNTLNKLVAQVKIDLDVIKPKYSKMKTYIKRKLCNTKGT